MIGLAQQPNFFTLDQNNALPSNTIYYTFQDSKGFVWFTSTSGLYKYDGSSIKNYQSKAQTSLGGSEICEDVFGRIWYINFDGYLYYVEKDQLKNLSQNKPIGFIPYGVTEKHLFVPQANGIDVYDIYSLKHIKTIKIPTYDPQHALAHKNKYYFVNEGIIYKIDENLNLTKESFFKNKKLKQIFLYPYKNKLFIASKYNETKKIYIFDGNLTFEKTVLIPEVSFIQRADFAEQLFWIHTPQGTYAYDIDGKSYYPNGLYPQNSSSRVFKDHLNNFWFSSLNNGIYVVPELNDLFFPFESLSPLRITNINNGFLIGSSKGQLFTIDHNLKNVSVKVESKEKLANDLVYYDPIDQNIFYTDKGFSLVKNQDFNHPIQYATAIKDILRLDDKYYAYAATGYAGLLKNPKHNTGYISHWDSIFIKNIDPYYKDCARIIQSVRAKSVALDESTKTLYFATNLGIFKVNNKGSQEIKNKNETIYANQILFFNKDLFYLDTKGKFYKKTATNEIVDLHSLWKLDDYYFDKIKKYKDNILLMNNETLFIYNLSTHQFKQHVFNIKGNKLNDVVLQDSKILLLTDTGILQLNLQNRSKKDKVLFHINSFTVNNKWTNWTQYQKLSYDENNISIKFSVLEFGDKRTPFYYRINGEEWTVVNKNNREIQFPSLSAGDYLIEFKIGEKISNKKIEFKITIAFWKTWWFYMFCSMLGILILYIYFKWQYYMMKNQMKLFREKIELEKTLSKSMLASIKSQMNPHFFYNALNTIQAYIFTNDKFKANAYLSKFSKLTRMILEMSEKETISLDEEITALRLYIDLEKMRFTDSFSYEIVVQKIIDYNRISLPPMLIQPFVENAIKHGLLPKEDDKKLLITFYLSDQKLVVEIDDNGIGRKKAEELKQKQNEKHQSFSTKANEKRLELLNKGNINKIGLQYIDKINPETNESLGTTVLLYIPL